MMQSKTRIHLLRHFALAALLFAAPARAADSPAQILQKMNPDICFEESGVKGERTFGSCFAITPGVVVMSYHQENGNPVTLKFPGGTLKGHAQFYDPDHDLTFITIAPQALAAVGAKPIRLVYTGLNHTTPGMPVYFTGVVGDGQQPIIRPGMIGYFEPEVRYQEDPRDPVKSYLCHITATVDQAIEHEMSGGPVLTALPAQHGLTQMFGPIEYAALGLTSTRSADLQRATFVPAETIVDDYKNLFKEPLPEPAGTPPTERPKICAFNEDRVLTNAAPKKQVLRQRAARQAPLTPKP